MDTLADLSSRQHTTTLVPVAAAAALALLIMGAAATHAAASPRNTPIIGRWTLVHADMKDVRKVHREFAPLTKAQENGRGPPHPIDNVQPTYVDVIYGGPTFEEWDVNGPNDLTLRLGGPYVTSRSNCRYHRG